jgi:predicted membrane protein
MARRHALDPRVGIAREITQGIIVLALTGSSVGGLLAMVAIAARALGR